MKDDIEDLSTVLLKMAVVIHLRNYYFLTTFHCRDLTHFAAFCSDLAMMKMSRGHYEQNTEGRSVLETRQKEASDDPNTYFIYLPREHLPKRRG